MVNKSNSTCFNDFINKLSKLNKTPIIFMSKQEIVYNHEILLNNFLLVFDVKKHFKELTVYNIVLCNLEDSNIKLSRDNEYEIKKVLKKILV